MTEAIVDVALSENRRFAVVPCCVFAERFAHRELEPGDRSEMVGIGSPCLKRLASDLSVG